MFLNLSPSLATERVGDLERLKLLKLSFFFFYLQNEKGSRYQELEKG